MPRFPGRALVLLLLLGGCASAPREGNVVLLNRADPALDVPRVLGILQAQYDFLRDYTGSEPGRVVVFIEKDLACAFSTLQGTHPEMHLQDFGAYDPSNNVAHEMMHCFLFRYGWIPHWFNESIADMAYVDTEVVLRGGDAGKLLEPWDRVDRRSYEFVQLRKRYGPGFFPRVCRALEKRREECLKTFRGAAVPLEEQNRLLLSVLSEAALEDLTPVFVEEFGFNPRKRERQRGY